ncbi:MAG: 16S rRNA (guanine(527)-N(7))-methyltransferase RsmG [Oscillospiraceae bacterium]|jgi:16S rRNA (guanine(527)-N(7))-methyltransferase RsmG|nr:16S rRNA (guanine(527)-N(7))-methyltransferase RsmG [Oscillospiraceae bacterium]
MPYEFLKKEAQALGVTLSPSRLEKLRQYTRLLLDWNERFNLTAVKEERAIAERHYLDSLTLLKAYSFAQGARLLDVGSGAGFPGVPLKLARPDISLTMLDSLNKRTVFLAELSREMEQDNEIIHGRAEELAHKTQYRESFDAVTARAVAPLPLLCELCLGLVGPGGVFLAMKGPGAEEELKQAKSAIEIMGGRLEAVERFTLPEAGGRSVIIVKKISQTPPKYPRSYGKMSKTPL